MHVNRPVQLFAYLSVQLLVYLTVQQRFTLQFSCLCLSTISNSQTTFLPTSLSACLPNNLVDVNLPVRVLVYLPTYLVPVQLRLNS